MLSAADRQYVYGAEDIVSLRRQDDARRAGEPIRGRVAGCDGGTAGGLHDPTAQGGFQVAANGDQR